MQNSQISPLTIIFGNGPGLTFYTFPKYQFTPDSTIRNIYDLKIKILENKKKPLTREEEYQLEGLKHNINIDPRFRDVCYGTLQDAEYGIEAADNLDSVNQKEYVASNTYLCDWHKCYDFESACTIDTPELASIVKTIVDRKRPFISKPHYGDYHFLDGYKVELLPGDQVGEKVDVLEPGDRLIVITRPVGDPVVAKRALRDILDGLQDYKADNVTNSLTELIGALNRSYLVYMGNPEEAPKGGAMILAIYLNQKTLTYAQVGPISLKHKISGHYQPITQDHTFDSPSERERTQDPNLPIHCYQLSRDFGLKSSGYITEDEANYLLTPRTPSRFIGHPDYCLINEEEAPIRFITSTPDINLQPI